MSRRDEEPCVWADEVARNAQPRRVNGRKIVERFPQTAENGRLGRRWDKIVDPAGNVVNAPITTAGSLFDLDDPGARYIKRKHVALGFFPLGSCPVALVMAGELQKEAIDESMHGERPCQRGSYTRVNPCPHALREIAFRQEAQRADWNSRKVKIDEDEGLAKQLREERSELLKGFGEVMKDTILALAGAKVAPGAEAPEKPSKSK